MADRDPFQLRVHEITKQMVILKMMNMVGGGFRTAAFCHYERGILLENGWDSYYTCRIFIASDPNTEVHRGCTDSFSRSDPFPKCASGEFIRVWANGIWEKDGPWRQPIMELVDELGVRVDARVAADEAARAEACERRRLENEARENALRAAWTK